MQSILFVIGLMVMLLCLNMKFVVSMHAILLIKMKSLLRTALILFTKFAVSISFFSVHATTAFKKKCGRILRS